MFPNSTKFVVTVNMGNNTILLARDEIEAAIKYIGWDRIRAIERKYLLVGDSDRQFLNEKGVSRQRGRSVSRRSSTIWLVLLRLYRSIYGESWHTCEKMHA